MTTLERWTPYPGVVPPTNGASARSAWPWMALIVFAGCFLGARAGVWLTFPVIGAAVLFAPYAVVGTALSLAPARHFWIYLLAGSLGNCLAHRGGGEDIAFVLL